MSIINAKQYDVKVSTSKPRRHHLMLSGAILLLICLLPTAGFGETLDIPGTGACEKILQKIAAVYNELHPGREVIVPPSSGSNGGIKAVATDKAILARTARTLTRKGHEAELKYLPFARDAILFTTGKKVSIENLSSSQLSEIFVGKIEFWNELSGSTNQTHMPIRVLVREETDSSLQIIKKQLQAFSAKNFSRHRKTVYHDYEMLRMLKKYPTSIGWLTRSSMIDNKQSLGVVSLDGVAPTSENIQQGLYPLIAEYALVYKGQALPSETREFINFMFSARGGEILTTFGLTPIPGR